MTTQRQVWAMVGPTASGKSAAAIALAKRCGGMIINCDSVQVYRSFDIGSAKSSLDERGRVPHRLIDIVEANEDFDAATYIRVADEAVEEAFSMGLTPILCGGTGLYLRAFRFGLLDMPARDRALVAKLEKEEKDKPGCLFTRLKELDAESAERIHPNNLFQIIRALEICVLTGKAASTQRKEHGFKTARYPMKIAAIRRPLAVTHARIAKRVERMLAQGLVAEVEGLVARGFGRECRAMRAINYREVFDFLKEGKRDMSELTEALRKSNVAYARRQRTWFNKEKDLRWFEGEDDSLEAALWAFFSGAEGT